MHPLLQRSPAYNIKVKQSVVVVVEPDASRAGAFQQRAEFLCPEAVSERIPEFEVASSKRIVLTGAACGVCANTMEVSNIGLRKNAFTLVFLPTRFAQSQSGQPELNWNFKVSGTAFPAQFPVEVINTPRAFRDASRKSSFSV